MVKEHKVKFIFENNGTETVPIHSDDASMVITVYNKLHKTIPGEPYFVARGKTISSYIPINQLLANNDSEIYEIYVKEKDRTDIHYDFRSNVLRIGDSPGNTTILLAIAKTALFYPKSSSSATSTLRSIPFVYYLFNAHFFLFCFCF